MLHSAIAIYASNLHQVKGLAADIPEDKLNLLPYPGGHDARWVLGHIAISADYCASLFGLPGATPAEWATLFGPGSKGSSPKDGPSKAELLAALERGHARVTEAARSADAATLGRPHGVEFLKDSPMKTMGDFIAFLMTAHEAYHVAQLSACRAALGKAPLF